MTEKEINRLIDAKLKPLKSQINTLIFKLDQYVSSRSDSNHNKIIEANDQIEDTQLGLAEAYEYTDGAYNEVTDLQLAITELYEIIEGI